MSMVLDRGTREMARSKKQPDEPPRKPSESRRHSSMIRVEPEAAEKARAAASLLGVSVADYVSSLINRHAPADIARAAKRFTSGEGR
jgi:predicted HicB family RNase H-like nuclease